MIDLYQDVLVIAKTYVGIAAENYIKRRCSVSFGLDDPKNMKQDQIERLAESIGMTAEAYISADKARQFKADILNLKDKPY
jgi:phage gp16-like protein